MATDPAKKLPTDRHFDCMKKCSLGCAPSTMCKRRALPMLTASLVAFVDLCPRMSDGDPVAPALAAEVKTARGLLRDLGVPS